MRRAVHRILCALHAMLGARSGQGRQANSGGEAKIKRAQAALDEAQGAPAPREGCPAAARTSERKCFFDCELDELRKVLPRSAEDEESAADAERWYRQHFRWGWPRR